jgi:hypothetical protein
MFVGKTVLGRRFRPLVAAGAAALLLTAGPASAEALYGIVIGIDD